VLAREFHARGDDVVVLSRGDAQVPWQTAEWDGRSVGPWASHVDGADVVINLAGRSVNCRYTARNRREILDSRIESTRAIGDAIAKAVRAPRLWLQSSTATIYADRTDVPNDEATGVIGGDEPGVPETWKFSVEVARAWEEACNAAPTPRTRKVLLRSAMIMSSDTGGIFDTLRTIVRRGLGGKAGSGRQYVSWIHERDFVGALDWLIEREEIAGVVNVASPNPLPQAEFMADLRRAVGAPVGLPATNWMLEVGAFLMGTETELILKSRRVVPGRLLANGFVFAFPRWLEAANDLTASRTGTPGAGEKIGCGL
jgi:uncharacterized protein (TIGR01777 family)